MGPVKTLKSVRAIDIPEALWQHLDKKYRDYMDVCDTDAYRNTEVLLDNSAETKITVSHQ